MRVRFAVHAVVAAVVFAGGTAMACPDAGGTMRPLLSASAVGSRSGAVEIPKAFAWNGNAAIHPKGSWGGFELIDKAGRLRAWGVADPSLGLQITGGDDFMQLEWSATSSSPLPVPPPVLLRRARDGRLTESGVGFGAETATRIPSLPAGRYTFAVLGDGPTSVVVSARTTARPERPALNHRVTTASGAASAGATPADAPATIARATVAVPHAYHLVLHVITTAHDAVDAGGYDSNCLTSVGGYCETDPNNGPGTPTLNDPTWWLGGEYDLTLGTWGPGDVQPGRYDAVAERADLAPDAHLAELAVVLP